MEPRNQTGRPLNLKDFGQLTEAVMAPPVPGNKSTSKTEVIPIVICNPPPTAGTRVSSCTTRCLAVVHLLKKFRMTETAICVRDCNAQPRPIHETR